MMKPPEKIHGLVGFGFHRTAEAPDQGLIVVQMPDGPIDLAQDRASLLMFGEAIVQFATSLAEPKVKR